MSKKNNVKQVSFTKLDKYIKEFASDAFEYSPLVLNCKGENPDKVNEMGIQIRRSLPLFDMVNFAEDVANGCFVNVENEDGAVELRYAPYYKDIYIGRNILKYYTNIKEIDSLDRLENLVFGDSFGIVSIIKDNINLNQLDEILKAIDDLIDFRKQELLNNKKSGLDSLVDGLNKVLKTIDKKIEQFDIESLAEHIPAIIDIFASGKLDPEKFAKAFVEAKSESIEDGNGDESESNSKIVEVDFGRKVDTETGKILE